MAFCLNTITNYNYRMDTKNGGPVFWMSENYVCPNCVKEPGDSCCQSPPEGAFCTPDTRNMTQKTPQQLKRGCERFRFIPGLDETAGSYEIGLYFEFQSVDGFPTGCEVELQTKVREDFTISKKGFSWLKAPDKLLRENYNCHT